MNPQNPPPPSPGDDLKKAIARIESYNDVLAAFRAELPKSIATKPDLKALHTEITEETDRAISARFARVKSQPGNAAPVAHAAPQNRSWIPVLAIVVAVLGICGTAGVGLYYHTRVSQLEARVAASERKLQEISDWQAVMVRDWQRVLQAPPMQGRRP